MGVSVSNSDRNYEAEGLVYNSCLAENMFAISSFQGLDW